jgi:hypothetical protein
MLIGLIGLTYLVSLMGGGSSNLALVTRSELSEVTVVVALPIDKR